MDLNFWPGAIGMVFLTRLMATLESDLGHSAWFVGVLVVMVYLMFATRLYFLPPHKWYIVRLIGWSR